MTTGVSDAELVNLINDAMMLWGKSARAMGSDHGVVLDTSAGRYVIVRGTPPVRWRVDGPGPSRRAVPSVTALLSVLRWSLDIPPGLPARVAAP